MDDYKKLLQEIWGDEKPIWVFCPICDEVLESDGFGHYGKRQCTACKYTFQQNGSYASIVTISGKRYDLDDMFDDSNAMHLAIAERKWLKNNG
jgi:hypothetical protein